MKIIRNSKLTNENTRLIIDSFCAKKTSLSTANELKINRHTVERIYSIFRKVIGEHGVEEPRFLYSAKEWTIRGVPLVGISNNGASIYLRIIGVVTPKILNEIKKKGVGWEKGIDYIIEDPKRYIQVSEAGTEFTVKPKKDIAVTTANFKDHRIFRKPENNRKRIDDFLIFAQGVSRLYEGFRRSLFKDYLKEIEWRYNNRKLSVERKSEMLEKMLIAGKIN